MAPYLVVFAVTLAAAIALVLTQRWHGGLSMDTMVGVQKVHTLPTSRVGGMSIVLGVAVAYWFADGDVRRVLGPMLLAAVPAFAAGLIEDLTKRVSVAVRLMATMLSGVLAFGFTGVAMRDTGFAPLDLVLCYTPFAVLFTAFAVGGLANAVNIIDGFNGLAAGSVTIMLGAIGLIALGAGDADLATVCFLVVAVAVGFCAVNWPYGKLFLGDGGAYLLGFLLGWVAVLLPMRVSSVNAFTTLLVCAYPVLEVAFSVRRRRSRKAHAGHPDRMHLHHLLHRRLVCQSAPRLEADLKNAFTSPACWLLTALPGAWAVAFSTNTAMLILGICLATIGYAAVYARLTQFRWCFSALTVQPKRQAAPSA